MANNAFLFWMSLYDEKKCEEVLKSVPKVLQGAYITLYIFETESKRATSFMRYEFNNLEIMYAEKCKLEAEASSPRSEKEVQKAQSAPTDITLNLNKSPTINKNRKYNDKRKCEVSKSPSLLFDYKKHGITILTPIDVTPSATVTPKITPKNRLSDDFLDCSVLDATPAAVKPRNQSKRNALSEASNVKKSPKKKRKKVIFPNLGLKTRSNASLVDKSVKEITNVGTRVGIEDTNKKKESFLTIDSLLDKLEHSVVGKEKETSDETFDSAYEIFLKKQANSTKTDSSVKLDIKTHPLCAINPNKIKNTNIKTTLNDKISDQQNIKIQASNNLEDITLKSEHHFAKSTEKTNTKENQDDFVYKTAAVRGNARKNLPGWSCNQCANFYDGLELSEEELRRKMDMCSNHREKFKPLDETFAGFWDVTMPETPENQEAALDMTGSDSEIFDLF